MVCLYRSYALARDKFFGSLVAWPVPVVVLWLLGLDLWLREGFFFAMCWASLDLDRLHEHHRKEEEWGQSIKRE